MSNAVILSRLLETTLADADETQAQRLARVSPIAWRHINFQGRYNFRQISQVPDIDELVGKLKLYPISLIESLD
ncbi:MAG: Tn3 family transposase [Chloroflexi bacterium]|nr:Tn3 family transposase [Chloroflexota bacterium]